MLPTAMGAPASFVAESPADVLAPLALADELLFPLAPPLELLVLPQAVADATIPTITIASPASLTRCLDIDSLSCSQYGCLL
jgi:hypothetical protein